MRGVIAAVNDNLDDTLTWRHLAECHAQPINIADFVIVSIELGNDVSQSTNRTDGRERNTIVLVNIARSLVDGHLNARVCEIHGSIESGFLVRGGRRDI
jgi:hypothetical protein